MSERFEHGYALLIGVDENYVAQWALPEVRQDVAALQAVLTHPQRCAYPEGNLKRVTGQEATRQGILDGLDWLAERLQADDSGQATAVVYYSGHGWRDVAASPPAYYLIPYDMRVGQVRLRALPAADLAAAIAGLQPRRLLVVLDCCHAGGMEARDISVDQGYTPSALPADLMLAEGGVAPAQGARGLAALQRGHGRAVLSSSQGEQVSWSRKDRRMGVFTYHLIEALTGHAQPQGGATEVLVSDIMGHVSRRVPVTVMAEQGQAQEPDYRVTGGSFPVALLLGGKGLARGAAPPDPLEMPLEPAPAGGSHATVIGDGNIVAQDHSVVATHGGIAIGGSVGGDVISGGRRKKKADADDD